MVNQDKSEEEEVEDPLNPLLWEMPCTKNRGVWCKNVDSVFVACQDFLGDDEIEGVPPFDLPEARTWPPEMVQIVKDYWQEVYELWLQLPEDHKWRQDKKDRNGDLWCFEVDFAYENKQPLVRRLWDTLDNEQKDYWRLLHQQSTSSSSAIAAGEEDSYNQKVL